MCVSAAAVVVRRKLTSFSRHISWGPLDQIQVGGTINDVSTVKKNKEFESDWKKYSDI